MQQFRVAGEEGIEPSAYGFGDRGVRIGCALRRNSLECFQYKQVQHKVTQSNLLYSNAR